MGLVRQGRLARFVPYSVSGGFLAGTGFLVAGGGLKVLTGTALSWANLGAFERVPVIAWVTAGFVVVALMLAPRFSTHVLAMPVILAAGGALFYAGLALTGQSVDAARDVGLLLKPLPSAGPAYLGLVGSVRWDLIARQWSSFLAMAGVAIVTIALNSAALDMETQADMDFDRELRVSGLAGILAGLGGGMVGALSLSRSSLNRRAGSKTRFSGVWMALVCLAAMYAFPTALTFLPTPLLGGLLVFLGLSMLRQWLWASYFRLPRGEYLLVLAIMLVILVNGLIAGVGVGLLAATCLFVYHYGKIETIRNLLSGAAISSNRERTPEERTIVHRRGSAVRVLRLQGYIFFGTSSAIVAQCRQLLEQEGARYLVLDFRLVQGIDVSSVAAFAKLALICHRLGASVLFSDVSPMVRDLFDRSGLLESRHRRLFDDLDRALEWVEDRLLVEDLTPDDDDHGPKEARLRNGQEIHDVLEQHFAQDSIQRLRGYCEAVPLERGETLIRQGEPGEELFLIEEGLVSVLLRNNGRVMRLRTFGPGTIVGEMALYTRLTRSADVVADAPCRVWRLSARRLAEMEHVDPALAIEFHTFIIKVLSVRLGSATLEIQALR